LFAADGFVGPKEILGKPFYVNPSTFVPRRTVAVSIKSLRVAARSLPLCFVASKDV
jgi:hypothetical protein